MFDEIKSKFQNSSTDGLRKNLTMSLGPARTCSKDMFVNLTYLFFVSQSQCYFSRMNQSMHPLHEDNLERLTATFWKFLQTLLTIF